MLLHEDPHPPLSFGDSFPESTYNHDNDIEQLARRTSETSSNPFLDSDTSPSTNSLTSSSDTASSSTTSSPGSSPSGDFPAFTRDVISDANNYNHNNSTNNHHNHNNNNNSNNSYTTDIHDNHQNPHPMALVYQHPSSIAESYQDTCSVRTDYSSVAAHPISIDPSNPFCNAHVYYRPSSPISESSQGRCSVRTNYPSFEIPPLPPTHPPHYPHLYQPNQQWQQPAQITPSSSSPSSSPPPPPPQSPPTPFSSSFNPTTAECHQFLLVPHSSKLTHPPHALSPHPRFYEPNRNILPESERSSHDPDRISALVVNYNIPQNDDFNKKLPSNDPNPNGFRTETGAKRWRSEVSHYSSIKSVRGEDTSRGYGVVLPVVVLLVSAASLAMSTYVLHCLQSDDQTMVTDPRQMNQQYPANTTSFVKALLSSRQAGGHPPASMFNNTFMGVASHQDATTARHIYLRVTKHVYDSFSKLSLHSNHQDSNSNDDKVEAVRSGKVMDAIENDGHHSLRVEMAGTYFVYFGVHLVYEHLTRCEWLDNQVATAYLVKTDPFGKDWSLVRNEHTCCETCPTETKTEFAGGIFHLEKGSRLHVEVTDPSIVEEGRNTFIGYCLVNGDPVM